MTHSRHVYRVALSLKRSTRSSVGAINIYPYHSMLSRETFDETVDSSAFDRVFKNKLYKQFAFGDMKDGHYQIENLVDHLVDEIRDILKEEYPDYYNDFCGDYDDNDGDNWASFLDYFDAGDGAEFLQTWDYEGMKEARLHEWATASVMNYCLLEEAYEERSVHGAKSLAHLVSIAQEEQARRVRIAFFEALEAITV